MDPNKLEFLLQAISATAALGVAAFGIVDISKAFWGGPSRVGMGHLERGFAPFAAALDAALGADRWRDILYSHWINGRPMAEQKAIVRSLVRLGLNPDTAEALARAGRVDAAALKGIAEKLRAGKAPTDEEMTLLGRMDTAIEAQLDAAFERADQQYRSVAKFCAAAVAIVLALIGAWVVASDGNPAYQMKPQEILMALLIGALAVPIAPIAKDLTTALTSAASAFKAAKGT